MATLHDLRKTVRENLDDPRLAVVFFETKNSSTHHFANVLNLGVQGVLIESDKSFEKGIKPKIMMKNPELDQWDTFFCRVAWAQITESEKQYKTGLEFLFPVENGAEPETGTKGEITPQDIEFLLNTRLIKALSKDKLCSLLNCMSRKTIDDGIPFISSKNHLNGLYIIQKGQCKILLKTENDLSLSAEQKREGDVIGDMAFLSTEPFISDAVSESEMVVWELPATKFDSACRLQPGLIQFLTGLFTNRLNDPSDSELKSVGRYIISHPIGEGRTGFVFKGRHELLNAPVAIKMIKHHPVGRKEDFNGFKKRISRIAGLNHPNIARVYTIEEKYRTVFIIMEYIDGESLESLFEKKISFSLDTVLLFLAQICSALAYAHDQKINHKHLTPSSIFISKGSHLRISDFGFAAPIPEEGSMEDKNYHYSAPERIKGGKTDLRSDIYSLGMIAYELFSGQRPFSRENGYLNGTDMNSLRKIDTSFLRTPDLPEYLKKFILKACATLPDMRYNSVHAIIEELSNESCIFKETMTLKKDMEPEICALLISYKENQRSNLFKLLDDFSQKAMDLGIKVNITGKIHIDQNRDK